MHLIICFLDFFLARISRHTKNFVIVFFIVTTCSIIVTTSLNMHMIYSKFNRLHGGMCWLTLSTTAVTFFLISISLQKYYSLDECIALNLQPDELAET